MWGAILCATPWLVCPGQFRSSSPPLVVGGISLSDGQTTNTTLSTTPNANMTSATTNTTNTNTNNFTSNPGGSLIVKVKECKAASPCLDIYDIYIQVIYVYVYMFARQCSRSGSKSRRASYINRVKQDIYIHIYSKTSLTDSLQRSPRPNIDRFILAPKH